MEKEDKFQDYELGDPRYDVEDEFMNICKDCEKEYSVLQFGSTKERCKKCNKQTEVKDNG